MIVFFLLFIDDFSFSSHGCGDVKEDILGITEETEDNTELAVAWKRKMFSIIDSLKDLSAEQEVFAKTSVIEFWNNMIQMSRLLEKYKEHMCSKYKLHQKYYSIIFAENLVDKKAR